MAIGLQLTSNARPGHAGGRQRRADGRKRKNSRLTPIFPWSTLPPARLADSPSKVTIPRQPNADVENVSPLEACELLVNRLGYVNGLLMVRWLAEWLGLSRRLGNEGPTVSPGLAVPLSAE
jgi:hypothetical protein